MKHTYQICISGAAAGPSVEAASEMVKILSREVVQRGHIVLTGASSGLPHIAALAAVMAGGASVGFSPAANRVAHIKKYHLPLNGYTTILYTGFDYAGRDLLLVRSCDAMLMAGGRLGTLHELAVALVERRPVGVLLGSSGVTDEVKHVLKVAKRERTNIIFDDDPKSLVDKVLKVVDKRYAKLRLPSLRSAQKGLE